jgi:hypothetical protein
VGPRAGLGAEVRGKILCLRSGIEPRTPSPQPFTILTELPGSYRAALSQQYGGASFATLRGLSGLHVRWEKRVRHLVYRT